jgi:ubiquinol-cytochrome c reductase cytochrome b subunit
MRWPFVEAWRAGPGLHQVLDRPRDHPARLGVGVAALVFFALLVVAVASTSSPGCWGSR